MPIEFILNKKYKNISEDDNQEVDNASQDESNDVYESPEKEVDETLKEMKSKKEKVNDSKEVEMKPSSESVKPSRKSFYEQLKGLDKKVPVNLPTQTKDGMKPLKSDITRNKTFAGEQEVKPSKRKFLDMLS